MFSSWFWIKAAEQLLCFIQVVFMWWLSSPQQGIEIKSPVQWPYSKGLSFCCWLRVESFPENGMMGLFSFFTENGKGCLAMLGKNTLVYEVMVVVAFIFCENFRWTNLVFRFHWLNYILTNKFFGKLNWGIIYSRQNYFVKLVIWLLSWEQNCVKSNIVTEKSLFGFTYISINFFVSSKEEDLSPFNWLIFDHVMLVSP